MRLNLFPAILRVIISRQEYWQTEPLSPELYPWRLTNLNKRTRFSSKYRLACQIRGFFSGLAWQVNGPRGLAALPLPADYLDATRLSSQATQV